MRKRFCVPTAIALSCLFSFSSTGAFAAYPDHPVHLILGFPPGGGTDVITRLIGQKLSDKWKQPVVIENKAGADGTIGESEVAHAPPDGYMIAAVNNNHTLPETQNKLDYDPVKSFIPITLAGASAEVLAVNNDVPINSISDLIAAAKAKPGSINIGSSGGGTSLTWQLFMHLTNTKMTIIGYKGSNPVMVGVLGGEVQVALGVVATYQDLVKAGKVKGIAVTSHERFPSLPDIPTFFETPGMEQFHGGSWLGFLAPKGTPPAIVKKVHDDINAIVSSPEVKDAMLKQAYVAQPGSPEDFTKFIGDEMRVRADLQKSLDAAK